MQLTKTKNNNCKLIHIFTKEQNNLTLLCRLLRHQFSNLVTYKHHPEIIHLILKPKIAIKLLILKY